MVVHTGASKTAGADEARCFRSLMATACADGVTRDRISLATVTVKGGVVMDGRSFINGKCQEVTTWR